ncbi:large ribosomal subunit protein mL49-like [Saccostrea echinata]|uniref:large ribosomal subunit protein mL49-like n=1 Tax=Saccostrea echinata TaxID=191078 RepID=UPI002A7EAC9E|nr:large ribosomal subunit protein mL49-like [Saccostrea echinata]
MAAPMRKIVPGLSFIKQRVFLQNIRKRFFNQNARYCTQENTSSTQQNVEYEESTEEFKYVEKLLHNKLIPEPPQHAAYPTPSGWFPQTEEAKKHPYFVHRTPHHNMPVYLIKKGPLERTKILKVDGDLQLFSEDLKKFLSMKHPSKKHYLHINEINNKVLVRGDYVGEVVEFLKEKGF